MSNVFTSNLETKTYTLFISSNDRISGNHNNGVYQVNWDDFLPKQFTDYKMTMAFQSSGGNYKDSSFANSQGNTGSVGTNTITLTTTYNTNKPYVGMTLTGDNKIPVNTYITAVSSIVVGTQNITLSKKLTGDIVNVSLLGVLNFNGLKIQMNSNSKNYSFDTSTLSQSLTLGYAQRDIQTTASSSNSFSSFYLQFPPKTINRPSFNNISISVYNINNNLLLTDSDANGSPYTDMTAWNMILEFIPIPSSESYKHFD
jgi:hypothetical protein